MCSHGLNSHVLKALRRAKLFFNRKKALINRKNGSKGQLLWGELDGDLGRGLHRVGRVDRVAGLGQDLLCRVDVGALQAAHDGNGDAELGVGAVNT